MNTNSEPKFEPSATIAQARSGSTAKRTNMTRLQPPVEWNDWKCHALNNGIAPKLAITSEVIERTHFQC